METIKVLDVDCNGCAGHVRKALEGVDGISKIDIRLEEKIALVTFDAEKISKVEVAEKVEDFGYEVE